MRVILTEEDLTTVITEYLARRGVTVEESTDVTFICDDLDPVDNLTAEPNERYTSEEYYFKVDIGDVQLPPKDGPYR